MRILIAPDGNARCLYSEAIDLRALGTLSITRASNVEFDVERQEWVVYSLAGVKLFSDPSRETCLRWEEENIMP